ncbi:unnamed protein product, partial [Symbiodinium sp. CCMP2456]
MDTDHRMEAFITTPTATALAAFLLMTCATGVLPAMAASAKAAEGKAPGAWEP